MSDPIEFKLADIVTATHELCKKLKITDLEPSDLLVQEFEKQQVIYKLEAEHNFDLILKEKANVYNAFKKTYQEIQQKNEERIQRMETAMALKLAITNQLAKDPNWEYSSTTNKWEKKLMDLIQTLKRARLLHYELWNMSYDL